MASVSRSVINTVVMEPLELTRLIQKSIIGHNPVPLHSTCHQHYMSFHLISSSSSAILPPFPRSVWIAVLSNRLFPIFSRRPVHCLLYFAVSSAILPTSNWPFDCCIAHVGSCVPRNWFLESHVISTQLFLTNLQVHRSLADVCSICPRIQWTNFTLLRCNQCNCSS
jgi:hypothetical protein